MDFTQLKNDLDDMQAEREAALREAHAAWQSAERALECATHSDDMRAWTQDQRDQYETACDAAWQAWRAYEAARKAL